jgi:quinol-cytochrome oxidoreductase complex cytochrome b subunit
VTFAPAHNDPRLALRRALRTPIPDDQRADLWLGGLVLVVFLTQVFTGILLSLYYQPSPVTVAASVQFIMRDVSWGWLVRGVHHWSASVLIVLCAAGLARAFFLRLYRTRPAGSWYLGWFVLALVVALAFTGELLTWDNQAFWRVQRALLGVEAVPLVGPSLASILRGGPEVSATTLSRTYSLHTLFAPWLVWMLLLANAGMLVWRLRRRPGAAA